MRPLRYLAALLAALLTALALPLPAHAVTTIAGYAWGWQPAVPNYFAVTGYEYNSAGGAVEITRFGVGNYRVRFHNMAGTGGVAHASAYGANHLCTVVSWGPSLPDELVDVRCYTTAGAPVDTRFLADVTNKKSTGRFGYLWSNDPTPPAAGYIPSTAYSYDSAGQQIVVYRPMLGRYRVHLGVFALDSAGGLWADGTLRVTAYGSGAKHCDVLDPALQPDPTLIEVRCYDDTGFAVDSRFSLTYARANSLLGSGGPYASATVDLSGMAPGLDGWSNTAGGAPAVTQLGVGVYQLTFPLAGVPRGHVLASVMGTPPMFCDVSSLWQDGTSEVFTVHCYDGNVGVPTPVVQLNLTFVV